MKKTDVIIRPLITEKSMSDVQAGKFTFQVAKFCNKYDIKKAIENTFKVKVVSISTGIIKGRKRRSGTRRVEVVKSPFKKAVVKLAKGQKIDMFEAGA